MRTTPQHPDGVGGPKAYDGPMVRLHHPQLGVQVHVAEHKAAHLITQGYREGALPTTNPKG